MLLCVWHNGGGAAMPIALWCVSLWVVSKIVLVDLEARLSVSREMPFSPIFWTEGNSSSCDGMAIVTLEVLFLTAISSLMYSAKAILSYLLFSVIWIRWYLTFRLTIRKWLLLLCSDNTCWTNFCQISQNVINLQVRKGQRTSFLRWELFKRFCPFIK